MSLKLPITRRELSYAAWLGKCLANFDHRSPTAERKRSHAAWLGKCLANFDRRLPTAGRERSRAPLPSLDFWRLCLLLVSSAGVAHAEYSQNCTPDPDIAKESAAPLIPEQKPGELYLKAGAFKKENQELYLYGGVLSSYFLYTIQADQIIIPLDDKPLRLFGNVRFSDDQIELKADQIEFDQKNEKGSIDALSFVQKEGEYSGRARHASASLQKGIFNLEDATLTRCLGASTQWSFHLSELTIDEQQNKLKAYNPVLRLGRVPIFYFPYLSFPADFKPTSGFLTPLISYSRRSGFPVNLAYYWRIDEQNDMTFAPRWWTRSGFQYNHEYRFLNRYFTGEFNYSFLDSRARADNYETYRGHDIDVFTTDPIAGHSTRLLLQGVNEREYPLRYDTGLETDGFFYNDRLLYRYQTANLNIRLRTGRWRESFHTDPATGSLRVDSVEQKQLIDFEYLLPLLPQGWKIVFSTKTRDEQLRSRLNTETAPIDVRLLVNTLQGRGQIEYIANFGYSSFNIGGLLDYVRYWQRDREADPIENLKHQLYGGWTLSSFWRGKHFNNVRIRFKQIQNPERPRTVSIVFGGQLENWQTSSLLSNNPYVDSLYLPKQQVSALVIEGDHRFKTTSGSDDWRLDWKLGARYNRAAPRPSVVIDLQQDSFSPTEQYQSGRWVRYQYLALTSKVLGSTLVESAQSTNPSYQEWTVRWNRRSRNNIYDIFWRKRTDVIDQVAVNLRIGVSERWYISAGNQYDFIADLNSRVYTGASYTSCCLSLYFDVSRDLYNSFSVSFQIDLFGRTGDILEQTLPRHLREQ